MLLGLILHLAVAPVPSGATSIPDEVAAIYQNITCKEISEGTFYTDPDYLLALKYWIWIRGDENSPAQKEAAELLWPILEHMLRDVREVSAEPGSEDAMTALQTLRSFMEGHLYYKSEIQFDALTVGQTKTAYKRAQALHEELTHTLQQDLSDRLANKVTPLTLAEIYHYGSWLTSLGQHHLFSATLLQVSLGTDLEQAIQTLRDQVLWTNPDSTLTASTWTPLNIRMINHLAFLIAPVEINFYFTDADGDPRSSRQHHAHDKNHADEFVDTFEQSAVARSAEWIVREAKKRHVNIASLSAFDFRLFVRSLDLPWYEAARSNLKNADAQVAIDLLFFIYSRERPESIAQGFENFLLEHQKVYALTSPRIPKRFLDPTDMGSETTLRWTPERYADLVNQCVSVYKAAKAAARSAP